MEYVWLLLAAGAVNTACFLIGAKVGQAVTRGDPVEVPSVNPLKAVREHKAKKEEDARKNRNDIILRNIDRYDGTGCGQVDVPGGG